MRVLFKRFKDVSIVFDGKDHCLYVVEESDIGTGYKFVKKYIIVQDRDFKYSLEERDINESVVKYWEE